MESSDSLYLLFASGKYYFFVPVSWVKKVADGSMQEDELHTISLAGKEARNARTGYRYRIYLEREEICFAIAADKAVGIRNLEAEQMIPLSPPVINEANNYLQAAVLLETEEEQDMAYVLNPEYLIGKESLWNI